MRWRRYRRQIALWYLRTFLRMNRASIRIRNIFWRRSILLGRSVLRPFHRYSRFLGFWKASAAAAVAENPVVVISSDLPGLVGASRAARRLRRPHMHDCHELYLESTALTRTDRYLLRRHERRHMRRADTVLAVNRSIANEYRRRYGLRRVRVIRNCAQRPAQFAPVEIRDLAQLPRSSRVLLYQGGFSRGRGLDVVLAGLAQLPQDVALVLLGYGPLEESLRSQANGLGITSRFRILPAVPPDELLPVTASATLGVIPYQPVSLNNYFCLPNKIYEYTAVGVPVIASDLPELRKIAVTAGCGITYNSYDPSSFAAATMSMLDPVTYASTRRSAELYGHHHHWGLERLRLEDAVAQLHPLPQPLSESPAFVSDQGDERAQLRPAVA
ncbi:MAG: glycosyltransferase, partial [Jiangellaceae bacterium]